MRYEKYDIGHKLQFTRDQPHRVFSAAHPSRCKQEVLNDGDGNGEGDSNVNDDGDCDGDRARVSVRRTTNGGFPVPALRLGGCLNCVMRKLLRNAL